MHKSMPSPAVQAQNAIREGVAIGEESVTLPYQRFKARIGISAASAGAVVAEGDAAGPVWATSKNPRCCKFKAEAPRVGPRF